MENLKVRIVEFEKRSGVKRYVIETKPKGIRYLFKQWDRKVLPYSDIDQARQEKESILYDNPKSVKIVK